MAFPLPAGPAFKAKLAILGIHTVEDLLYYFPTRYDDFTRVAAIRDLTAGDTIAVEGEIQGLTLTRAWRGGMQFLETVVGDASGTVRVVWFNQTYLMRVFKKGTRIALAGKVYENKRGVYFANPAYEVMSQAIPVPPAETVKTSPVPSREKQRPLLYNADQQPPTLETAPLHTRRLVPVYRETKGLTSRALRILAYKCLPLAAKILDPLPKDLVVRERILPLEEAFRTIHFPATLRQAIEARRRFQFEELFTLQVRFAMERRGRELASAHAIPFNRELVKPFVAHLPFSLTDDQRKVSWRILQDMELPHPMQRLVEGDVGSGKTIVAFLAVLETVKAGYQAALMAPTEVLARQHFENAKKILVPQGVRLGLSTGSSNVIASRIAGVTEEKKLSKEKFAAALKDGTVQFAIGTHALISSGVRFSDLALAIVDEQHRFGVEQRARLLKKAGDAAAPHFLSMSATPIPRTLALAVYGDLDISRIEEMPPGRQEIETRVILPAQRMQAYMLIRDEVRKGRQVFVICPRIEIAGTSAEGQEASGGVQKRAAASADRRSSAWSEVKAVKNEYEKLSKVIFPDLKVIMLHGKLPPKEKTDIMKKFSEREFDILVSTSVIEVGVDVPNATVMVIEGAERFGLSTLHQFRGRVGRSVHKSYALLMSDSAGEVALQRLRAMVGAKNGFELAQLDLELRGPGEFVGDAQSGVPDIAMEALRDLNLIERARTDAQQLMALDPDLSGHPALREKLSRFGERVHGE